MLEIMIVTHGKLSEGLKDAAEVIVGTSSHIETMCLESGEDIQTFGEKAKEKLTMINTAEPMLVFVDLISASPYNQALLAVNELTEEKKAATYVIGGVNLPMLLEAINHQMLHTPIEEAVEQIVKQGKDNLTVWHASAEEKKLDEDDF
ncbi:PTS fructose transporter subunit IIA [Enterococcus faecium]|uniref:PTS sugar transporter subunit IIA n=1 Tax=Enterococcus faecium TaxID=1352 RepID=UPI0039781AE1